MNEQDKITALYLRAFQDPDFHRRLERQPGMAKPLKAEQTRILMDIEALIADGTGDTMTIRLPRQYGKNEIAAEIHKRHLLRRCVTGGSIVRAAPTFRPQIVNSMRRLHKLCRNDPLFEYERLNMAQGFIAEYGEAEVFFLSSDEKANPEGATADVALDMDEAHKTSMESYEERFVPMCASTNAPQILWGVAAAKTDLLYKTRQRNFELGLGHRNIQIPAMVIAETDPIYRRHYENRVSRLGADHIVVETQYNLVDVDSIGGAFKPHHRNSLFDSIHGRQDMPIRRDGCTRVTVIDLAGEEELTEELDEIQTERFDSPDSTVIWHAEIDRMDVVSDKPMIRILDCVRLTGVRMQAVPGDDRLSTQEIILDQLNRWKPETTLIDARGLGQATARWLDKVWHGRVIQYAATRSTASEDMFDTYAYLNLGQLKMWRDDNSDEYRQLQREIVWVQRKVTDGEVANLVKPSPGKKIDMIKAITYLPRAAQDVAARQVFGFSARL